MRIIVKRGRSHRWKGSTRAEPDHASALYLVSVAPNKKESMKKTFAYHKPGADGLAKITQLREAFSGLSDLIEAICPKSREASVALTNLETTAMWAIKAVVCNDPESEVTT